MTTKKELMMTTDLTPPHPPRGDGERLALLEQLAQDAIAVHRYLVMPDINIPCVPEGHPCGEGQWPDRQCVVHAVPFGEGEPGGHAPYGRFMATLRALFPDENLPPAKLPTIPAGAEQAEAHAKLLEVARAMVGHGVPLTLESLHCIYCGQDRDAHAKGCKWDRLRDAVVAAERAGEFP